MEALCVSRETQVFDGTATDTLNVSRETFRENRRGVPNRHTSLPPAASSRSSTLRRRSRAFIVCLRAPWESQWSK